MAAMMKRPCRKIRVSGWRGMFGAVSPSRYMTNCPFCLKPCRWYIDKVAAMKEKRKKKMKCPFSFANSNIIGGSECDPECALLLGAKDAEGKTRGNVCSLAAIGSECAGKFATMARIIPRESMAK